LKFDLDCMDIGPLLRIFLQHSPEDLSQLLPVHQIGCCCFDYSSQVQPFLLAFDEFLVAQWGAAVTEDFQDG
jgi:hypothetical protein